MKNKSSSAPQSAPSLFFRRSAVGLATVLTLASLSYAQDTLHGTPPNTPSATASDNHYSSLSRADGRFLVKAGRANSEEIAIARVATTRAMFPEVRAFAQEIVTAADSMGSDISRLAAAKTISLDPAASDTVSQKWNDKRAVDFDREFVQAMVGTYRSAVDNFEDVVREGKDADLATFAREEIGGLKDRLNKAEQLRKALE